MRRIISIVAFAGAILFAGRRAGGQQVRGTVSDSGQGSPIPGAVVSATDGSGRIVGRSITDAAGRFTLTTGPNTTQLRVVRIGFVPRDLPIPPAGAVAKIAMARIPTTLQTMRISGKEICPGSDDRGPAFLLWEQARAGLLATVVARQAKPAKATTMTFKRYLDVGDKRVRRIETKSMSSTTTRPFLAVASAAQFARTGYLAEDADTRVFFMPDADVLLDESFGATHCFHLTPEDADHKGQVGIAFTPTRDSRDTTVDVRGVIWLNRATPSVGSLDFVYTALERAAQDNGAGGHIEFVTVANGISFVERWVLRIVDLGVTRPQTDAMERERFTRLRRADRVDVRATGIEEDGGQVLAADWPDGTTWRAPEMGIHGRVVSTGTNAGVPNAMIAVDGYHDTVTTDSAGAFSVSPLAEGRYRITAVDTSSEMPGLPPRASVDVDVSRDHVSITTVRMPQITSLLKGACKDQRDQQGSTTLVGRVVTADGAPISSDATIAASWLADFRNMSKTVINMHQSINIDERGRFVVCGVAVERPVQMHLDAAGGRMADTTVYLPKGTSTSVTWRVSRP